MKLGQNIRTRRLAQGKTVRQLAEEVGVSHPMITRIEMGHTRPSLMTAMHLADALGCSVSDLIGDREPEEPV